MKISWHDKIYIFLLKKNGSDLISGQEKIFFCRLFQRYIPGEENPNEIIFHVTIGSVKTPNLIEFHTYAPEIKYLQDVKNSFVLSSLESALFYSREYVIEQAIDSRLKSSLKSISL